MKLTLKRQVFNPEYTLGELFIDGVHFCYTVEDCVRPENVKVPGKTAIAKGQYKVILNLSNRFQKLMPLLLDVPNFAGVRIHSGNTAADSEGCIIVGLARTDNGVGMSRVAFQKLMDRLMPEKNITIDIQ